MQNPTVEQVEKEIDDAYASSKLIQRGYAQAMWTLLSVQEDDYLRHLSMPSEQLPAYTDNHINLLTHPLRVCLEKAPITDAPLKQEYITDDYEAALEWVTASDDYAQFNTIFPMWHRGRTAIAVEGRGRLKVEDTANQDKRYEAYNRLIQRDARKTPALAGPDDRTLELLGRCVTVSSDWFCVDFSPALASRLVDTMLPATSTRHTLPETYPGAEPAGILLRLGQRGGHRSRLGNYRPYEQGLHLLRA